MKPFEAWVTSFVERASDYFNLGGWTINIQFKDEENTCYADNEINSPYQFSTINLYKKSREDFESGEFDLLVMALVHEIVHIFIDPFQDFMHPHLSITTTPLFMSVLEQQTQKLTMVFLKSLPPDIIPPRPHGKHNRTRKNNR